MNIMMDYMNNQSRIIDYHRQYKLGYESGDPTMHPPPRTAEGEFIFFRIDVLKCPQRKSTAFRKYSG